MKWMFLGLSILFEILGTTSLKVAGMSSKYAGAANVLTFIFYFICFGFLQKALNHFDVGMVYAIWAGLGVCIIAILGIVFFGDSINLLKIVSLIMIIGGIVGLNLGGISH